MRRGLTVSAIGHAALIALGVWSLPAPNPLDASQIEAIPVDFVKIGDTTSVPKGLQTAALVEEEPPSLPVEEPAPVEEPPPLPQPAKPPSPEPAEPEPPPPPPEPPPPEPPPPPPEPSPESSAPPPEETVAALSADAVPQPRPRPEPPKPKVAHRDDFDIDQITAMLDRQPDPEPQGPPEEQPPTFGSTIGSVDAKMTQTELDALRARLAQCWNPPIGWSDPSEVRVVLMLNLNADGSMSGPPQVVEAPGGRYAQTAPESAVRAVRRCAPYNLPAEKYDAWKQVKVTFDPTDMGGVF